MSILDRLNHIKMPDPKDQSGLFNAMLKANEQSAAGLNAIGQSIADYSDSRQESAGDALTAALIQAGDNEAARKAAMDQALSGAFRPTTDVLVKASQLNDSALDRALKQNQVDMSQAKLAWERDPDRLTAEREKIEADKLASEAKKAAAQASKDETARRKEMWDSISSTTPNSSSTTVVRPSMNTGDSILNSVLTNTRNQELSIAAQGTVSSLMVDKVGDPREYSSYNPSQTYELFNQAVDKLVTDQPNITHDEARAAILNEMHEAEIYDSAATAKEATSRNQIELIHQKADTLGKDPNGQEAYKAFLKNPEQVLINPSQIPEAKLNAAIEPYIEASLIKKMRTTLDPIVNLDINGGITNADKINQADLKKAEKEIAALYTDYPNLSPQAKQRIEASAKAYIGYDQAKSVLDASTEEKKRLRLKAEEQSKVWKTNRNERDDKYGNARAVQAQVGTNVHRDKFNPAYDSALRKWRKLSGSSKIDEVLGEAFARVVSTDEDTLGIEAWNIGDTNDLVSSLTGMENAGVLPEVLLEALDILEEHTVNRDGANDTYKEALRKIVGADKEGAGSLSTLIEDAKANLNSTMQKKKRPPITEVVKTPSLSSF